jgi:hypothetical protein
MSFPTLEGADGATDGVSAREAVTEVAALDMSLCSILP